MRGPLFQKSNQGNGDRSLITYRRPSPDEADAMAAFHVACWRESYADILPGTLMTSLVPSMRLTMWQSLPGNRERFVLTAWTEDLPIGFVISGPDPSPQAARTTGHIYGLYVARSQHRKGLGATLLKAAADDWLSRGGQTMTVGVLAANAPARSFYEAMGARVLRTGTYDWDGHQLAHVIYVFETLPAPHVNLRVGIM
jgi:ribosomal protein S18 acetylase RimI-like enzyme